MTVVREKRPGRRAIRWGASLLVLVAAGCVRPDAQEADGGEAPEQAAVPAGTAAASASDVRPGAVDTPLTRGDTLPGHPSWTRQDLEVLERTLRWAYEQRVDTLPVGERVARIGETFVGTAYIPRTLDPPGPERLVVNLRALDCVTYVEGMLTLAHLVRRATPDVVERPEHAMELYEEILTSLRYRDGRLDGYASRLHYFSEWILDNEEKGWVTDVTAELGGVADPEPVTFMTRHRDAYDQLADEASFRAVGRVEERLAEQPRHYVPEERVADVKDRIRTGDVIAATSTVEGLDVAHTGIAVWKDGVLHLMHAPLVGEAVQVSEEPLGRRLLGIGSQDGIMVARPLEYEF